MQLLRIDWNVVFTIINLIVLYLGLRKFLIGPVTNVMEQRKQMIEGQIADANKLKAEAGDLKKQYEGMLAQAHEESAELLEKTRKSAQAEYENRINVADAEAEKTSRMPIRPWNSNVTKLCRIFSHRLQFLQWQQQEKYLVRQVRTRITGYCINSF